MNLKRLLRSNKGFTLIELLVVVSVISVLFVAIAPQIDNATNKSRVAGVKTDFRSFQLAAETYLREVAGNGLTTDGYNSYLDQNLRVDATTNASLRKDPWGQAYRVDVSDERNMITVISLGKEELAYVDGSLATGIPEGTLGLSSYYSKGRIESCTVGLEPSDLSAVLLIEHGVECGEPLGDFVAVPPVPPVTEPPDEPEEPSPSDDVQIFEMFISAFESYLDTHGVDEFYPESLISSLRSDVSLQLVSSVDPEYEQITSYVGAATIDNVDNEYSIVITHSYDPSFPALNIHVFSQEGNRNYTTVQQNSLFRMVMTDIYDYAHPDYDEYSDDLNSRTTPYFGQ